MNSATLDNEIASDTTSPTAPHDKLDLPRVNLSEAEYLAREKADAAAALRHTLGELKQSLRTSVDVRLWTKEHPWVAVGIAAAAGFTAATVVVPKSDETLSDKLANCAERLKRQELTPPARKPDVSSGLAAVALASLFDLAKVTVEKVIAASAAPIPPKGPSARQAQVNRLVIPSRSTRIALLVETPQ